MRSSIICYINGERHELNDQKAGLMLSEYLRYEACLTGTKVVCAEGDCAACTVLKYNPIDVNGVDSKTFISINSCITPMASLDGTSLITVDALSHADKLHIAQDAMVHCHGSQCGFCTPGFVMAMAGLVEEKKLKSDNKISDQEAKNALTGNLCRCTGYDAIIEACKSLKPAQEESLKTRFYPAAQEKDLNQIIMSPVHIKTNEFEFFAPTNIVDASNFLLNNPETRIIAASTDLGVVHNKRKIKLNKLLSLHLIKDLYTCNEINERYEIGARVTLSELRHFLKHKNNEFVTYLDIFASPQIKNLGTLVGNVANASPIGDTPPPLLALNAMVELSSQNKVRTLELSDFFLDYRKTDLKPGEIITKIIIPKLQANDFFKLYKNSNRKDLDISTVNFAIHVRDKKFTLAAGGVAATPLRLKKTEDFLNSNELNTQNIYQAIDILHTEFKPLSDVRGTSSYRRILIENYFKRSISQYMEMLS
jgi:xanthine dehydrogenase small subunit